VSSGKGHDVVFHRLAGEEYLKARRRYVREGGDQLAERFSHEVEEAAERIVNNPAGWPTFRKKYHWVRLNRFPYMLYYRVLDGSRIIVLAVAHAARRPGYWLRRAAP